MSIGDQAIPVSLRSAHHSAPLSRRSRFLGMALLGTAVLSMPLPFASSQSHQQQAALEDAGADRHTGITDGVSGEVEASVTNDQQELSDEPGKDEASESQSKERLVTKLLPDFKMLKGSPAATLDVLDLVRDSQTFRDDEAVAIEVIFNKKEKVVAAEVIDNKRLVLKPGKIGTSEIVVEIRSAGRVPVHSKFSVQVWEPDYWNLGLTVIGGLGIFLLGMKSLSDGLQAVAGNGLRKMIAIVTNNRIMAAVVGALVTMILQSSSITTVMVVGLVNSGFMTLTQAIGVIFGANIGTTITGWILVLKIGKYGLPIAGAAAFGYLFIKRDSWRYAFMAIMGLGMVFLGLELMKDGFSLIKDLPAFERWFERFAADSYVGVLKCAAIGCALTFIVQSSSATLGITIGLAQIGVIPFETAAALVLGENVGTTITAWLASFGTTTNAKRAAYAHVAFNLIGVAWITAIFPWYLMVIRYIVGGDVNADVSADVTAAIAATHTGFNITNTIVFLPLVGVLARALQWCVPERAAKQEPKLTNLDVRILESPMLAIEQSRAEVIRISDSCLKMMAWLKQALTSDEPDPAIVEKIAHEEQVIDRMQDEVVSFMTSLLASNIPEDLIGEARRQLRMADEYESISDYIGRILKYHVNLQQAGLRYEEPEREHLQKLHDMVDEHLHAVAESYRRGPHQSKDIASQRGRNITKEVRDMRREIMDRMGESGMQPRISVTYNRQLIAYRRVRDHVVNIAEAIAGLK